MPAQRTKASLGPHSLELLYSKYGTDKLHTSIAPSSSNPTTSRPNPSPSPLLKNLGKTPRHRRPPPPILRGRELGDLTKLGCGLTKLERVHLLLDMPHTGRKSKMRTSRSQSRSSAGMNASLTGAVCSECSQTHRAATEGHSKLQDLKSKLRLVAPRSLPDKTAAPQSGSSSARQSGSQNVVPLPLLHIRFQNQDSGSREFSAEGRQAIRGMLLPQQQYRSSVAVWNFRTPGGSLPARSQEFLESADASSRFLTSAGIPPSSGLGPARTRVDTETISTFDADRMDSEQFEYVFDRFSALSTESDYCTTVTPESDTATFSARAQRPSTTDTVVTYQHLTHRWSASRSRPLTPITRHNGLTSRGSPSLSPTTPQHKTHAGKESWPPRFTVRTSWPAVDDPFRFQYLGRGVQRDVMRRLHRSRGGKKRGSQSRPDDGEPPQPPQQEPVHQPPQKLDIVLPTDTECHPCRAYECEHLTTPRQGPATTARSTRPPSLSTLSVHSRVSECRSRTAQSGHKPVVTESVVEDSDKAWCIEKTCRGDSMTFDRGHYTAHNVVN